MIDYYHNNTVIYTDIDPFKPGSGSALYFHPMIMHPGTSNRLVPEQFRRRKLYSQPHLPVIIRRTNITTTFQVIFSVSVEYIHCFKC